MTTDPNSLTVGYLVNQYPSTSHTFIRREIIALEEQGFAIARFTVRASFGALVDPEDQAEQGLTTTLLDAGAAGLVWPTLATILGRPVSFLRALGMAWRLGRRSGRGVLIHLAYLGEAARLRRELQARGARHLHVHFASNPAAVALLCRCLGGPPYSFTGHGTDLVEAPRSQSLDEKARHAAFAVAVCSFGRAQLYRWIDYEDWGKVQVVRCGLDSGYLRESPVPVPDVPRLVCVGRLSKEKGQPLLIEAIARLREEGLRCELVLVGDGPMRGDLEALVGGLGVGDRVRFAGWKDGAGVREEVMRSRVLVLSSFSEGLPVVLMEAMALGRPVISTWVGGIPELVQAERSGWLVPPGSVEALVSAIREALSTPVEVLTDMGRAGAAVVAERHDAAVEGRVLGAKFLETVGEVEH